MSDERKGPKRRKSRPYPERLQKRRRLSGVFDPKQTPPPMTFLYDPDKGGK